MQVLCLYDYCCKFPKFYNYIIFNSYFIYEVMFFYLKQLYCLNIPSTQIRILGHLLSKF